MARGASERLRALIGAGDTAELKTLADEVECLENVARLADRVHELWALGELGSDHSDDAVDAVEALGEALDRIKRDDWEE